MSLSQIIMYHNIGLEQKYGKKYDKPKRASEMTHAELKAIRDEMRAKYGDVEGDDNG